MKQKWETYIRWENEGIARAPFYHLYFAIVCNCSLILLLAVFFPNLAAAGMEIYVVILSLAFLNPLLRFLNGERKLNWYNLNSIKLGYCALMLIIAKGYPQLLHIPWGYYLSVFIITAWEPFIAACKSLK